MTEHLDNSAASPRYIFKQVPSPKRADAGRNAAFTIASGKVDPFSGGLSTLNDGQLSQDDDEPGQSFFFAAGTEGGRLVVDLGKVIPVREVNTFSWHRRERAPQVYQLYGAERMEGDFVAQLAGSAEPEPLGWTRLAHVDTRPKEGPEGGQYGVSIRDSAGNLGQFRYLLFDIGRTESRDPFGHTFFSEIDIVDPNDPAEPVRNENELSVMLDTSVAPDLATWSKEKIEPIVIEWYPKLIRMLASDGYEPPMSIALRYRTNMPPGIPASASGNGVNLNAQWFRKNLQGEALGSVVHELVHVVQNYQWGRRRNPTAARTPGWVVEGIADYIRWFLFEPENFGADITARNLSRARYDASYRVTANFLNWVATVHGRDVIWRINAAAREGRYSDDLWKELTGDSIEELGAAWKKVQEDRLQRVNGRNNVAPGNQPAGTR